MLTARDGLFSALCAGAVAGFLFFLSLSLSGNVAAVIFLPALPLLLLGLSRGTRSCGIASLAAMVAAALFCGITGAVLFSIFFVLPSYWFVHQTLCWRGEERARQWYPMLQVMTELTVLAAAGLMGIGFLALDHGGLKAIVPHDLAANFRDADPDLAASAQLLSGELSFLLLACVAWFWVVMPYGFAALANAALLVNHKAIRPSLAIESDGLPPWLLFLLIVSGLVAAAGEGADRFNGETVFLLLLLPYFLSGLSFVHTWSKSRPIFMRRLWIACFYIVLVTVRWPVLGVIAIGLYRQLAEILDRRKGMR